MRRVLVHSCVGMESKHYERYQTQFVLPRGIPKTVTSQDIRGLLLDWADEINSCERIWIRASSSNRKIFIDYDGAIIAKGSPADSIVKFDKLYI
jgi:Bacteroidetes VLRF1 release factor